MAWFLDASYDAATQTVKANVKYTDGTWIVVDGSNFEYAPSAGLHNLKLPPGGHDLWLNCSRPDCPVKVHVDVPAPVVVPTTGIIQISATPNASVYVDDVGKGITPINVTVPAGAHTVKILASAYNDYVTTVNVTAGGIANVNATLSLKPVVAAPEVLAPTAPAPAPAPGTTTTTYKRQDTKTISTTQEYVNILDLSIYLRGIYPDAIHGSGDSADLTVVFPDTTTEKIVMDMSSRNKLLLHGYAFTLNSITKGSPGLPDGLYSGSVSLSVFTDATVTAPYIPCPSGYLYDTSVNPPKCVPMPTVPSTGSTDCAPLDLICQAKKLLGAAGSAVGIPKEGDKRTVQCPQDPSKNVNQIYQNGSWVTMSTDINVCAPPTPPAPPSQSLEGTTRTKKCPNDDKISITQTYTNGEWVTVPEDLKKCPNNLQALEIVIIVVVIIVFLVILAGRKK